MHITIFIVIALGVVVCMAAIVFNRLVSLNKQTERAWANIDVILKQRFDEIPQLIKVIEGYSAYEQSTLEKIMSARNHYGSAQSLDEKIAASNEMSLALKGVIAIGEAYPDLKANNSFMQLQTRVSALEGLIADRRELFNNTVTNYNTRIEQIPDILFARILGYTERPLYIPPASETVKPSLDLKIG